jgi:hypothetical protein
MLLLWTPTYCRYQPSLYTATVIATLGVAIDNGSAALAYELKAAQKSDFVDTFMCLHRTEVRSIVARKTARRVAVQDSGLSQYVGPVGPE